MVRVERSRPTSLASRSENVGALPRSAKAGELGALTVLRERLSLRQKPRGAPAGYRILGTRKVRSEDLSYRVDVPKDGQWVSVAEGTCRKE